jgi:hypothetical protein
MNATVKTFATLAWALAIGKDFEHAPAEKVDTPELIAGVNSAGRAIHKAAHDAIQAWPKFRPNKKNIHQMEKSIKYLDSIGYIKPGQKRAEVMIACLLAAVEDLRDNVRNQTRRSKLSHLIDEIVGLSIIIDPEMSQTAHYIRGDHAFKRWVEGGSDVLRDMQV